MKLCPLVVLSLPRFPLSGVSRCPHLFTTSSDSLFHPDMSLVFFFQSSCSPAFLTSLLAQTSHLSLVLPRLLLPSSLNSDAPFGSMSSAILSMCPGHCSQLLDSLSVKLICTPVSSLISILLLLSVVFAHLQPL